MLEICQVIHPPSGGQQCAATLERHFHSPCDVGGLDGIAFLSFLGCVFLGSTDAFADCRIGSLLGRPWHAPQKLLSPSNIAGIYFNHANAPPLMR